MYQITAKKNYIQHNMYITYANEYLGANNNCVKEKSVVRFSDPKWLHRTEILP